MIIKSLFNSPDHPLALACCPIRKAMGRRRIPGALCLDGWSSRFDLFWLALGCIPSRPDGKVAFDHSPSPCFCFGEFDVNSPDWHISRRQDAAAARALPHPPSPRKSRALSIRHRRSPHGIELSPVRIGHLSSGPETVLRCEGGASAAGERGGCSSRESVCECEREHMYVCVCAHARVSGTLRSRFVP